MDLQQLQADRENGVIICNATWGKLITYATELESQKKKSALQGLSDLGQLQDAAPAAAVVTVDTPEFQRLLHRVKDPENLWGVHPDIRQRNRAEFIAHIDALIAQAREEGNTQGWAECEADMKPEYDAMRQRAEKAEAAAPQQHDILRAVIEVVRQYPDFDGETLFGTMMDEALAGKIPALLSSIDSLAAGVKPSPQQHAQAALSDEQIERIAELHFYSAYAATMDIRLHRFARAILAASQEAKG